MPQGGVRETWCTCRTNERVDNKLCIDCPAFSTNEPQVHTISSPENANIPDTSCYCIEDYRFDGTDCVKCQVSTAAANSAQEALDGVAGTLVATRPLNTLIPALLERGDDMGQGFGLTPTETFCYCIEHWHVTDAGVCANCVQAQAIAYNGAPEADIGNNNDYLNIVGPKTQISTQVPTRHLRNIPGIAQAIAPSPHVDSVAAWPTTPLVGDLGSKVAARCSFF
jgi:hypothetical protein